MFNPWDWLVLPSIFRIEWCLLAGLAIAVLFFPRRRLQVVRFLIQKLDQLAENRRAAVLVVIAAVMLGRAAFLPSFPIPSPGVHDEFAFLLTADTFLHGRLTNPTHPLWPHFEMFHVFQVPTYQSQYPIGYPIVMAAAWAVVGNPWWGVFATTALMCGALVWMLQGWIPARWALLGGFLAAIRVGLFSYWMNSYFGGSLAALGGCFFFGALPRIIPGLGRGNVGRGSPALYSFIGAVGLALLATTRPFEGLVVTVPGSLCLAWFLLKQRRDPNRLAQILLPSLSVLGLMFIANLIYQKAVTGDALKSPYTVVLEQYRIVRPFFFEALLPWHKYRNIQFLQFYILYEPKYHNQMGYFWGILEVIRDRFQMYWKFFVGPLLTLPLFFTRFAWKRFWFVWVSLALLGVGVLSESFLNPHYLAPGYPLFVLLLLEGVRRLRTIRVGAFKWGERMVAVLPLLCVVMVAIRVVGFDEQQRAGMIHWPPNWAFSTQTVPDRDRVADLVEHFPEKALIIVRYRATFHDPHLEWVNNGADLENTKVLWARSMSAEENCELVKYYPGRKFWVVDNWGATVSKVTPEDASQICDPANTIYERDYPLDYYSSPKTIESKGRYFLKPRQMY